MPKNTDDIIERRRMVLEAHMKHYDRQGKEIIISEMQRLLRIAGFAVNWDTVKRDIHEVNRGDTTISDLSTNYSKFLGDRIKKIKKLIKVTEEILDTKWTRSKQIKKQGDTPAGPINTTELIVTGEDPNPRLEAITIIQSLEKDLADLTRPGTYEFIAANWVHKDKQREERIKQLEKEKHDLENSRKLD